MLTGFYGAKRALEPSSSQKQTYARLGARFSIAGDAWREAAGGTSGALWGALLKAAGATLADQSDQLVSFEGREIAGVVSQAVAAGVQKVIELGNAKIGDKTMVDAAAPFSAALSLAVEKDLPLIDAWGNACDVATETAQNTATLAARKGRSKTHREASLGTPDPGAMSFSIIVSALREE